jgi:pyruvate dehydrogenase E2 component (dihydrolipoamide acetyltransferase)
MTSGHVVEWMVKPGDLVKEGTVLADVQTDKAVMPLESFDEGIVASYLVEIGEEVAVGAPVILLAKKGEDLKAVAAAAGKSASVAPVAAKAAGSSNGQEAIATAAPAETVSAAAGSGERVKSSPLARKVAAASNVDLAQVSGSGPGGRVIRADVEAFAAKGPAAVAGAKPAGSSTPARAVPGDTVIKLNRMQTTIAARMTEAKRVAPDIHVTVDIRIDQLMTIRERLNNSLSKEKIKLSVGDFVTKAVGVSLRRHPVLNATFDGESITRRGEVNVGIAVALPDGLIVPVLKNVDQIGLKEVRTGSEALYEAARANKLTAAQMNGGTFTISNLGMYGVREFDAILNLPQVGILAVGAGEKRAVVEGDKLVVGTVMTVTLTADHRVVNGADAAEFLRTLKGLLEEPATMLL